MQHSTHLESPDSVDWAQPVNWEHSLNRNLVSWWLCGPNQTGYGSVYWRDLCGRRDSTLTNMDPKSDWQPTTRPGGWGQLDCDGSNDYISLPSSKCPVLGSYFTVSCWLRWDSFTTTVLGRMASVFWTDGWMFWTSGGNTVRFAVGSYSTQYAQFAGIAANTWYHVVGMRSGSVSKIWVNGVEGTPGTAGTNNNSGDLNLGGYIGNFGQYADLRMDDFRIWSRGLSDSEILEYYRLSRQGYPGLLNRWAGPAPYVPSQFQPAWASRTTSVAGVASGA